MIEKDCIRHENTGGSRLPFAWNTPISLPVAPVRTRPGRGENVPWDDTGAQTGAAADILQGKAPEILY